jgi:HlyD family secretion protein
MNDLAKTTSGGALTTPIYAITTPVKPKDSIKTELAIGIAVATFFFVGILGAAAFAPLDSAAYATGQVTVSGSRQTVQHREGGVVGAIFVSEGDVVEQGDVLITLAAADVRASERAAASQAIGLQAQRARLLAEQGGGPIVWPAAFEALTGEDLEEAQRAMAVQQSQYAARGATLSNQSGVLGQRTAQLNEQILGMEQQMASVDEQARLLQEELDGMRELNERGFAPTTQVRALERALAQLDGQRAQLRGGIAQARERIGETRLQDVDLGNTRREGVAQELRDVEFALNEALPRWQALKDQLERIEIRAPASGTVVGLNVFTIGGVIAPGEALLDIVPEGAPLVLEAQVSPQDADDLYPGQMTQVIFSGLPDRRLPRLSGELVRLSADAFVNENNGQSYYLAEVTVPPEELDKIRAIRGEDFEIIPGMPVQVLVPLQKRTALQYITQPLTDTIWRSFRQH